MNADTMQWTNVKYACLAENIRPTGTQGMGIAFCNFHLFVCLYLVYA